jgi:tetratricopeptide (TPR) repeat protein
MDLFRRWFIKPLDPQAPTMEGETAEAAPTAVVEAAEEPPPVATPPPAVLPPPEAEAASAFTAALRQAAPRYTGNPALDPGLVEFGYDLVTDEPLSPAHKFPEAFARWQAARDLPTRRRALFAVLDYYLAHRLTVWQRADRLVEDLRPAEALRLLQDAARPREDAARFAVSYARAFLAAERPAEALWWAQQALAQSKETEAFYPHGPIDGAAHSNGVFLAVVGVSQKTPPQEIGPYLLPPPSRLDLRRRIRAVLADALFLTGEAETAQEMYHELREDADRQLPIHPPPTVEQEFAALFSFTRGCVRSPIYAVEVGRRLADPAGRARFWELSREEFLWSPYYRAQAGK